ncbi:MAG TPA: biotin/lipoyl-containing protein [Streptosporangiaceae bacterium]
MDLTNEDVADVLALLDSLPYDEFDLQTPRFRLTLRRTPDGWTRSEQILAEPEVILEARGTQASSIEAGGTRTPAGDAGGGAGEAGGAGGAGELVAVRAPLPGTFYRAPRPGAAPFVDVGSRVSADTVVGIVETMKLMNSVAAGADGTVAEICLGNAEPAAQGATLMRIRADR